MIILADGGSTTVDWRLVDKGKEVQKFITKGANPFFRTREDISEEIRKKVRPALEGRKISSVHFFGAGCVGGDKNQIIIDAISDNINASTIEINTDLLAAARGSCGKEQGIACILGTGSNSCFYDGENIIENVSPLGYILGDEGSGAVLGKLFIGACLKNQLTEGIKEEFLEEYKLTPTTILNKVYREPLPNRFLASLSPFIGKKMEDETIYKMIYSAFKEFFVKNVMQYDYANNKVHFIGSIAYYYSDILKDVAKGLDIEVGTIAKSPMDGLIKYYSHS